MERRHFWFPALTGRAKSLPPLRGWSCADKRLVAGGVEQELGIPYGRRADFLWVRQICPADGGGFLGEAAGEEEGVVVGRDVIVAAAADDLELVTIVEAEGGGVGAADFEDGLFGGDGARPA